MCEEVEGDGGGGRVVSGCGWKGREGKLGYFDGGGESGRLVNHGHRFHHQKDDDKAEE